MLCISCQRLLRAAPSCYAYTATRNLQTGLVLYSNYQHQWTWRACKAAIKKQCQRGAVLPQGNPSSSYRSLAVRAMSSAPEGVPTVSVDEANEMLAAGATYLDVRTKEEFCHGHAKGAINVPILMAQDGGMVPNTQFTEQVAQALPDKDETIVLGCKSGRRSEMAWHVLDRQDYSNMSNIAGGFDRWLASGLPTGE